MVVVEVFEERREVAEVKALVVSGVTRWEINKLMRVVRAKWCYEIEM